MNPAKNVTTFWKKLNNTERINLVLAIGSIPIAVYKMKDEVSRRQIPGEYIGFKVKDNG